LIQLNCQTEKIPPEPPQVTEEIDALDAEFDSPSSQPVIEHLWSEVDFDNSAGDLAT
jgi:hypothetical protein